MGDPEGKKFARIRDLLYHAGISSRPPTKDLPMRPFLALFALVAFNQIDASLRQLRHRVFDLLGRDLILRQGSIQLVIGDVAALFAFGNNLLNCFCQCAL